ncbi:MAG: hypothetical protein ACKOAD_01220 [Gammaproteobacteria bacterium]
MALLIFLSFCFQGVQAETSSVKATDKVVDKQAAELAYKAGEAFYAEGKWQAAAQAYQKALKLDTSNEKAKKALRALVDWDNQLDAYSEDPDYIKSALE